MAGHDIIVIGASAGGVETSRELVAGLPADLPAAVFLVIHLPQEAKSTLPEILSRSGPLPASHAADGEPIRKGHVYVAPPDHHLFLEKSVMRARRGPLHNGRRPAIDPLFRSAALHFGPRVIGVVLSGTLDDGTTGLQTIKRRGGLAVVQEPRTALFSGMPESALAAADVDHVLPAAEIGPLLGELARRESLDDVPPPEPRLVEEQRKYMGHRTNMDRIGNPSKYACPDCSGVLWEFDDEEDIPQFACRVGHSYSPEALMAGQETSLETSLWAAVRALEESADLKVRVAARLKGPLAAGMARRSRERAEQSRSHAEEIRRWLERDEPAESLIGGGNEGES